MVIFRSENLYSLCSPGNQDYQKINYKVNIGFMTENYHIPKFLIQNWAIPIKNLHGFITKVALRNIFKSGF